MDIIRFTRIGSEKTLLQGAEIVNGLKSKMWVERYREPGEFVFMADPSLGIQSILKIGTFVSHTDTAEVMIVENHELSYNKDNEMEVKISGRSFDSYLEQRITGKGNLYTSSYNQPLDLAIGSEYSWQQAHTLLYSVTNPSVILGQDLNDEVPYFNVVVQLHQTYEPNDPEDQVRSFGRENMHTTLMNLLQVDNLGIKIERPYPGSLNAGTETTSFIIHDGENKFYDVIFDHAAGDIESADYLWSNKHRKTAALVVSKWYEFVVYRTADTKYRRRYVYVDAKNTDSDYEEPPGAFDEYFIKQKMRSLAKEILARHKSVNLTKVEIAKDLVKYKYRQDYKLGDLIGVRGQFSTFEVMRVVEHVEVEDENGMQAYPTLAMDVVDED